MTLQFLMIHLFVKRYKYSTVIKKTSPGRTEYDAETLFKRFQTFHC